MLYIIVQVSPDVDIIWEGKIKKEKIDEVKRDKTVGDLGLFLLHVSIGCFFCPLPGDW